MPLHRFLAGLNPRTLAALVLAAAIAHGQELPSATASAALRLTITPREMTIDSAEDQALWTIYAPPAGPTGTSLTHLSWELLDYGKRYFRFKKTLIDEMGVAVRDYGPFIGAGRINGSLGSNTLLPLPIVLITPGWSWLYGQDGTYSAEAYECLWIIPSGGGDAQPHHSLSLSLEAEVILKPPVPGVPATIPLQRFHPNRLNTRCTYLKLGPVVVATPVAGAASATATLLAQTWKDYLIATPIRADAALIVTGPPEESTLDDHRDLSNVTLWKQTVIEWARLPTRPGEPTMIFSPIIAGLVSIPVTTGASENPTPVVNLPERTFQVAEALKDPLTGKLVPGDYWIRVATAWSSTHANSSGDVYTKLTIACSPNRLLTVLPSATAAKP